MDVPFSTMSCFNIVSYNVGSLLCKLSAGAEYIPRTLGIRTGILYSERMEFEVIDV